MIHTHRQLPNDRQFLPNAAWSSFRWSDLLAPEFAINAGNKVSAQTIAILPVAAIEQHGPHLPLNVDTAIMEAIIARSIDCLKASKKGAEQTPLALFLPIQSIGYSPEHQSFLGTLSLEPQTIINQWLEIGACVAKTGVRKILLFNSHGGNIGVMDMVARQLRVRHNMLVYSSSWNQLPFSEQAAHFFGESELRFGVHAGDLETSMMLSIAPELVDMSKAEFFQSSSQERAAKHRITGNGKSAKMAWQMADYNQKGAAGNAQAATPEKGRVLLQNAAEQLVALLKEMMMQELLQP